ncbi:MAG: glycosyltransferase [Erythrobacter sp.]|uniref:glycosyltransferase family 2 protein n=1 Tax=Erythrobacter sp. TaxID=1042 RepID=UPI0025F42D9A|nr:glycosyltransferase family 2 protein [Erythrobacter sp.]MCM0001417.1 glycosyltransferase [Erythrobacter sp.]
MNEPTVPQVSLIVCTRDRPVALAHCLAAIRVAAARTRDAAIELIVVDNAPTASAGPLVRALAARPGLTIRYLHVAQSGLARARNAGLSAAKAAIIACTDDDCRIDPGYFTGLREAFAQNGAGPVVMGGRVQPGMHDPSHKVRGGDAPETFHRGLVPTGFVLGCNLTFNRAAIAAIGLFDWRFGCGGPLRSGEDTDYILRAHQAGVPVIYSPRFTVDRFGGRAARAAQADACFGNGALVAKHLRASPWLARQLGRLVRGSLREAAGGHRFEPRRGRSHFPVLAATFAGMRRYWSLRRADMGV